MNKSVLVVGSVLCVVGSTFGFTAQAWAQDPKPATPTTPTTPSAPATPTNPAKPEPKEPATPATPETPATPAHPANPATPATPENTPAGDKPAQQEEAKLVYVSMKTSKGEIVLELNNEKAPISVKNFLHYTNEKYYDGTIFHRVIPNFMIQGGGFTKDMKQKSPTAASIKNEWKNGLKNTRGSIAMARLGRQPDSATCQFFINVQDNAMLDQPNDGAGYAVFGKVVSGLDVVDAIKAVPTSTHASGHGDVPNEAVVIESVKVLSDAEAAKYKK